MSSLRSLVVHANASHACEARLRLARRIGDLHPHTPITVVHAELDRPLREVSAREAALAGAPSGSGGIATDGAVDGRPLTRHDLVRAVFERVFGERPDVTWIERRGEPPAALVARVGGLADLLLLGQPPDPEDESVALPPDFAQRVLLTCGRPVLVVPREGEGRWPWGKALVAWDGSASCVRALTGALPLLQAVGEVAVLSLGPPAAPPEGSFDVADYLVLHGVRVDVYQMPEAPHEVGDALLAACRRGGAELLVTGCYGHGPARERWMGGVTRTLLREAWMPVLMMH